MQGLRKIMFIVNMSCNIVAFIALGLISLMKAMIFWSFTFIRGHVATGWKHRAMPFKQLRNFLSVILSRLQQVNYGDRAGSVLSAPTTVVLVLLRAVIGISRTLFGSVWGLRSCAPNPSTTQASQEHALELKIDALTQQMHQLGTRVADMESVSASSNALESSQGFSNDIGTTITPLLPPVEVFTRDPRRAAFEEKRRSFIQERRISLQRAMLDAMVESDSDESSTSSCPATPLTDGAPSIMESTLIIQRARQAKRRSTGLKPLLLPAILSQNIPLTAARARESVIMDVPEDVSEHLSVDNLNIICAEDVRTCDLTCEMDCGSSVRQDCEDDLHVDFAALSNRNPFQLIMPLSNSMLATTPSRRDIMIVGEEY